MDPKFKSQLDRMLESNPAEYYEPDTGNTGSGDSYPAHSNMRNLCFVLADRSRLFLNYNYLVSGQYLPDDQIIVLEFTTHTVRLGGVHLVRLYDAIMQQLPRIIVCNHNRYNVLDDEQSKVNAIEISRQE